MSRFTNIQLETDITLYRKSKILYGTHDLMEDVHNRAMGRDDLLYNTDNNFAAFTCTGNFNVDWGDGSASVNYSSLTTASYNYDKTTYSGLTSE